MLKKILYIVAQASGGVSFYISLFNIVSLFAHENWRCKISKWDFLSRSSLSMHFLYKKLDS